MRFARFIKVKIKRLSFIAGEVNNAKVVNIMTISIFIVLPSGQIYPKENVLILIRGYFSFSFYQVTG